MDFDLKQFKYDPDTNRVTAKVVVDAGGSKYRDYAEMKEDDYELSDVHKKILDERIAAHKAKPSSGSSWDEVKTRIRSQL